MAVSWVADVDKAAILDEADQLAVRHLQPAFADVRGAYASIGFDVGAHCERLSELVAMGRESRAQQQAAQNRYELESAERRAVVEETRAWFDKLHRAGRYAKATKHPLGDRLPKLMFTGETELESWRTSLESLRRVMVNFTRETVDWTTVGLTDDFLGQGSALFDRMTSERDDAIRAESERFLETERLTFIIDEIVDIFEQVHAARELAMAMTGRELPGLELSLVRAAAAPRGPTTPAAAPEAPAAPVEETGL